MTILIVLGMLVWSQTGAPAGMVLQMTGQVTVERGGAKINVRVAEFLRQGDRISVEAGGTVKFMFCPSSEQVTVPAGGVVELQANAVRVVRGGQPTRTPSPCALPKVALGQESLERIGGMRGRGNPPITLFTGGVVSMTRPIFEWGPLPGNPNYQVTLKNDDGDTIWQTRTTATTVSYPDTMNALAPGLYSWEVRATDAGGKVVGEQSINLEVKPGKSGTPSTDPAVMLIEATRLENDGYYSEAAGYFRALWKIDPKDERLARHLAWLYSNAGLITALNEQLAVIQK